MLVPVEEFERFREWREPDIDLQLLLNLIRKKRSLILKAMGIAMTVGIVVSLLMPPEYTATATLMPEYRTQSSPAQNLLERYGGLLGIGAGTYASSSSAIRVKLYPRIVQSLPFQLALLEKRYYYSSHDTAASLFSYYGFRHSVSPFKSERSGLEVSRQDNMRGIGRAVEGNRDTGIFDVGRERMNAVEWLRDRVSASLDLESGVVQLTARMPEATISAQVVANIIAMLTRYLVEYRTRKIQVTLDYWQKQRERAAEQLQSIRDSLAAFQDFNRNLVTNRARSRKQWLQSKYALANNLYDDLSRQLMRTKMRLQEETPMFKTLDPVQIPIERSRPHRVMIVLLSLIVGATGVMGYLWISALVSNTGD